MQILDFLNNIYMHVFVCVIKYMSSYVRLLHDHAS